MSAVEPWGERKPCPFLGCVCTHEAPCDIGWIDNEDEFGRQSVRPCPTCRPEQARIIAPGGGSPVRLAQQDTLRRRGKTGRR